MSNYRKSRSLAVVAAGLIVGVQLTVAKSLAVHGGLTSIKAGTSKPLSG